MTSYEALGAGATFEQSGGTHAMNGSVSVGGPLSAPATYSLSGGTLNATRLTIGGSATTSGAMTISGGTASVAESFSTGHQVFVLIHAVRTLTATHFILPAA